MDERELKSELEKYNFYHTIQLTEDLSTPGQVFPNEAVSLRALRTIEVAGKRVLDIGCRDGKFSFEAERMGASEIVGIDNDLSRGAVDLLIPYFKSQITMLEMNLFDLPEAQLGTFDVVLFFGVLYHLRYPFYALKIIHDSMHDGGVLLLETAIIHADNHNAILYCPIGPDSPFEATSCTFFNEKGARNTLESLGFQVEHVDHGDSRSKPHAISRLKGAIKRLISPKVFLSQMPITRSVFVCRKNSEDGLDPVRQYWNETHRLESE